MAKQIEISDLNPNIQDSSLEQVIHNSMIPYAEYVILDRALPRVEDGLKPVQRRILYTMHELSITPDKPYRKSARIVGDCLGKYHPHGDRSVYDAMVRMAQPFNMRMTLIDGHGNYGSVDGDSAAAMRYTEARLMPLAMELLRDLDKDTVKFSLNFDDTMLEPDMLPGRYPNLLVNGATGIAVGLATNIPPHNLAETIDAVTAFIDNSNISLKEVMKIIKGPDFPTGGYIIAGEDLERAYETGKGKIILRAKVEIENAENEKKNIVITQLPYQVNKANLLQKILELKENKKELFAGIYDISDESDRSGMRAVIKLRKDCDPQAILKELYNCSDLETSFGINMVAIADGKPQQMGLLDIIHYYVNYQQEVVLRRTRYEIKEAKEREHILEGLIICIRNIDEVVKVIKSSKNTTEARANLRERFDLSEKQAQAVLDMRLARLTNLEIFKLEEELKGLKELIEQLQRILDSKKALKEVIKKELQLIKRQFKDERRSIVISSYEQAEVLFSNEQDDKIESYMVVVNADGRIKRVPIKNYNLSNKNLTEKSSESEIACCLIETQSNCTVMMFTDKGNCYKVDCSQLAECKYKEKGQLLSEITSCLPEEKVIFIYPYLDELSDGNLIFFTKQGFVKKSPWSEYNLLKSSFAAIKLKEGDEVINIENDATDTSMLFVTAKGMCLNASKDDLPSQGRIAGGVRGISIADSDYVIFAAQVSKEGDIIAVTDKGMFKKTRISEFEVIGRYRKGVKFTDLKGDAGGKLIFANYVIFPYEIAVTGAEELVALSTDEIPSESRLSKVKSISGYKKGFKAKSAYMHRNSAQYITIQTK
jgi:DNA gyrase subunit A